jgi:hypothetical protein
MIREVDGNEDEFVVENACVREQAACRDVAGQTLQRDVEIAGVVEFWVNVKPD